MKSCSRAFSPAARACGAWRQPAGGQRPFSPRATTRVSVRRNRLAYVEDHLNGDIWRLDIAQSAAAPLIASTRQDVNARYSLDGMRIVFVSGRSGDAEIWVADADGRHPTRLTSQGAGVPSWSPDGRQIAFDSRSDIYVVNSDGGMMQQLTKEPSQEVRPNWSLDGRHIYFASNRTGDWQIWQVPRSGGPAIQITRHGGREAFAAPDGASIFAVKPPAEGLWQVSLATGEEKKVLEHVRQGPWTVASQGIYYLNQRTSMLELFRFATRNIQPLAAIEPILSMIAPALSASPDGRYLLYTQDQRESDIMLLEGFR